MDLNILIRSMLLQESRSLSVPVPVSLLTPMPDRELVETEDKARRPVKGAGAGSVRPWNPRTDNMNECLVNGEISTLVETANRGLNYGDGIFETLLVHSGRPRRWQAHMDRLGAGCEAIGADDASPVNPVA